MDPLAHEYAAISPYAYVANNPISYLDPNGAFRTKFGAWLYSQLNGGDVIYNDDYKNKNYKYSVTSMNEDGSAGITSVSSWEKSPYKLGHEAALNVSFSTAARAEGSDFGRVGYTNKVGSVTTSYNLVYADQGYGHGNDHRTEEYFEPKTSAGMSKDSYTWDIVSTSVERGLLDVKIAEKRQFNFRTNSLVKIREKGVGFYLVEAKSIKRDNESGEYRIGVQEDWGKSFFGHFNVKFEIRFQLYLRYNFRQN